MEKAPEPLREWEADLTSRRWDLMELREADGMTAVVDCDYADYQVGVMNRSRQRASMSGMVVGCMKPLSAGFSGLFNVFLICVEVY